MALNLTDAYTASLIKNTEYVSSNILIDIMKKLGAMKFPKDIVGLVTSLHVIHHNGAKVYMASDVSDIISRIVIAEMGVEEPEPVPVQIDQSNIVSPFVHDEKIAAAVTETSVSETLVSETLTEEPVKREPLPQISSVVGRVVPHTGESRTSHANIKPGMTVEEKTIEMIRFASELFVYGGIANGSFTVTWTNGNKIVQDLKDVDVNAAVSFVLNLQETEERNIAANNA